MGPKLGMKNYRCAKVPVKIIPSKSNAEGWISLIYSSNIIEMLLEANILKSINEVSDSIMNITAQGKDASY